MALGDGNNKNNGSKTNYENSYFSRIKFNNRDQKLSLGFSFWKGLLKVSISEEEVSSTGVKYNEVASIHLSPMKAKLLHGILVNEIITGKKKQSFGINTGMGETQSLITFGFENDDIYVTICKLSPEGVISDSVKFTFNSNYHYDITYNNFDKMDFVQNFRNMAEIEMFATVLDEYVKSVTGAVGYGVMDMIRFDMSRVNTKLDLVMESMGIERKSSYQPSGSASNSYFNKNGAASSTNSNRGRSEHRSLEDMDDMLD